MTEVRAVMAEETYAVLKTTHGDVTVRLFPNHAPATVRNFVELAEGGKQWTDPNTGQKTTAKLYDGTIFHRIISGFMIQGGDPLGQGFGGPGYAFDDEIHPDLAFTKPYLLAVLHHRRHADLAQRQPHHLRRGRGRRQPQGRGRHRERADQRAGPAADRRRARVRGHRAPRLLTLPRARRARRVRVRSPFPSGIGL
jgi:cyclophilin family peptidyl-prolyl cis-trans isomerase